MADFDSGYVCVKCSCKFAVEYQSTVDMYQKTTCCPLGCGENVYQEHSVIEELTEAQEYYLYKDDHETELNEAKSEITDLESERDMIQEQLDAALKYLTPKQRERWEEETEQ